LSVAPDREAELDRAHSTAPRFSTGSTPGSAMSTALAWVLGAAPKAVLLPEKIFDFGGELGVDFQPDDHFPFQALRRRRMPVGGCWYWWATLSIFASLK
jgi:hypothetical protein